MARRKHHAKKRTHSRRKKHAKMSGIGALATNALAVIAGGVAAQYGAKLINNSNMSEGTKKFAAGGAGLLLGFGLPMLVKGDMIKSLGLGMIAVGGMNVVKDNTKGALGRYQSASVARRMALAPSAQNTRGTIAGLSTEKAAILTA